MFLPDYVNEALCVLKNKGYEGFLVGGCVRDSILGRQVSDYDIAVSCTPEQTKECFKLYRTVDTGIKHGTVTLVIDGHNLELTTFRTDGEYKDSRRPERVSFTGDIHEDVSRRDFTINAVCFNPESGFLDDFGGIDDIKKGIIRCVGEPEKRFSEDALRILRALRFAAVLDFSPEEKTEKALFGLKDRLLQISAERVFSEFKKLICGKTGAEVLLKYREIIGVVLPELLLLSDGEYEAALCSMQKNNSVNAKAAALFFPLGRQAAGEICGRFKTDNKFRKDLDFFLQYRNAELSSAGEIKRLAGEQGVKRLKELFAFRKASGIDGGILENVLKEIEAGELCLDISGLAIDGRDIEEIGFGGREIGELLALILEEVTDGRLKNERGELLAFSRLIADALISDGEG